MHALPYGSLAAAWKMRRPGFCALKAPAAHGPLIFPPAKGHSVPHGSGLAEQGDRGRGLDRIVTLATGRARLDDTTRHDSASSYFRRKRDKRLRALIESISAGRRAHILDLGGSVEYWRRVGVPFLRRHASRITVLNNVESELRLGAGDEDLFETAVGDACDLTAFRDGEADLVHSNSVVEHVGDWRRMRAFADETRRVGRSYYVQTPNYWFPIDPHYYRAPLFHWMPRPWQASLLIAFPIAHVGRIANWHDAQNVIDGTRLVDRRSLATLFPDATISAERVLGWPKSLIAIRS
jgi:hypothetical protein